MTVEAATVEIMIEEAVTVQAVTEEKEIVSVQAVTTQIVIVTMVKILVTGKCNIIFDSSYREPEKHGRTAVLWLPGS